MRFRVEIGSKLMRRVVKIGGSLLTRQDLPSALPGWIAQQPPAETLCIVGGGAVIDAVRRLDEIHPGDPVTIHWMCVDLLQTTFQTVASWFDWPTVVRRFEMREAIQRGFSTSMPTLVAVSSFYYPDADSLLPVELPHDWRTTTDSIAAALAFHANADEVVLLKSCEIEKHLTPQQMADRGIVDEAFPEIARRIDAIRVEKL